MAQDGLKIAAAAALVGLMAGLIAGRHWGVGGKDVFFFLTSMDRGRLQVLPVSFDVQQQEKFDSTPSMVRHFHDATDKAKDWRNPLLTFSR